jgi:histidinol-phosphate aminotransferase
MDIKTLVRKNILDLKPYTSARDNYSSGILLDANENSLGSVYEPMSHSELNRYPDPKQQNIRKCMSEYLSVNYENIFFGVGSDEIIDLLIRIFCDPGIDSVIIPEPTYGMYKVACDINNINVFSVSLTSSFQIDLDSIERCKTKNIKMIFLCSPNNPTGNILSKDDIIHLCNNFNGIVVVDEAYIDFDPDYSVINEIKNHQNLVVLRTFSKAWGLAGIRCGFAISSEEIINLLFKIKAPYTICKLTNDTVLNALKNSSKKVTFVNDIRFERERVKLELEKIDEVDKVFDSNANFILFRCNEAKKVYEKLVTKGMIIRYRGNQMNLKNCLRVTIGTKDENNLFLSKLKEVI